MNANGKHKKFYLRNEILLDIARLRIFLEGLVAKYGAKVASHIVAIGRDTKSDLITVSWTRFSMGDVKRRMVEQPAFMAGFNHLGYIGRGSGVNVVESPVNLTNSNGQKLLEVVNTFIEVLGANWVDMFLATPKNWLGTSYAIPSGGVPVSLTSAVNATSVRIIPGTDGACIGLAASGNTLLKLQNATLYGRRSAWMPISILGDLQGFTLAPDTYIGRVDTSNGKVRVTLSGVKKALVMVANETADKFTAEQVFDTNGEHFIGFTGGVKNAVLKVGPNGEVVLEPLTNAPASYATPS